MLKRSRAHYWAHGPISKWTAKTLGAPLRPKWGTMEEWSAFRKNQTTNFKLQERIEKTLSKLQNVWSYPGDVIHTIRCYWNNRFIDRTHLLETGLEPGKWYEYDHRLLYGMFNSFVQFIEKEQTLENLKWEMTLVNKYEWLPEEEAKAQMDYDWPCLQAINARRKMELYTWWKVERPARVDGYVASGFKAYSDATKKPGGGLFDLWIDKDEEQNAKCRELTKKWHEIDEEYKLEDTRMMIRLVELRGSCWT
jgi:hypothetical protein